MTLYNWMVCLIVGQTRGTQRYRHAFKSDEDDLTRNIVYLTSEYGHEKP